MAENKIRYAVIRVEGEAVMGAIIQATIQDSTLQLWNWAAKDEEKGISFEVLPDDFGMDQGKFSDASIDGWVAFVLTAGRHGFPPGSFHEKLIEAAIQADGNNLLKIGSGFPQIVDALNTYRTGQHDSRFPMMKSCRVGWGIADQVIDKDQPDVLDGTIYHLKR